MKRRNVLISSFVILWTLFFHYQTFRLHYLNPWFQQVFKQELPHIPLLFPPAGWIMFYQIDPGYGFAEVYGIRDTKPVLLDPHDILETRAVGYDNIHRNALIGVLSRGLAPSFCRFLRRKFPTYDGFLVVYAEYPDVVKMPDRVVRQVAYRCP
jgi:hypothetical protein